MNVGKYFITRMMTGLGLAIVVVAFGATSASAYPPGTAPVLSASASTVTQGGTITVAGTHFTGTVNLVGHSATVDLGTVVAGGPDGSFTATVTITAEDFPAGDHSIVASDAVGDSATFSFTVASSGTGGTGGGSSRGGSSGGGSSGGGLAFTGFAVMSVGGLGVLMLIGGGIMLIIGKRRKTTV